MIRTLVMTIGALAIAGAVTSPLRAQGSAEPAGEAVSAAPGAAGPAAAGVSITTGALSEAPKSPLAEALSAAIRALPPGATDEDRAELEAVAQFYGARQFAPLWMTPEGAQTEKARLIVGEMKRADDWGLESRAFQVPGPQVEAKPEPIAAGELNLTQAILLYGRHARGGRIINPSEQLSSYLDRRPQLLKPAVILDGIAAAEQPDAYLRSLHPQHPQFERLRQAYLGLRGHERQASATSTAKGKGATRSAGGSDAQRILANMEQWRWMPADLGEVYIWNNVPEFMQRVVKGGEVVRFERIVAGETGKQTPVFSRPLRRLTFKPTWKVPDSIKANELWPSLLKGGGLMREWGLEVYTKDGRQLDWRKMDWTKTDIREYDVLQPNGPKSVLGVVKFSFPNQHTVFMHDTLARDRYMFNAFRRTFSHGCMRVAKPMQLAEIILREDKGWDTAKTTDAFQNGPMNNEIALERKIQVHTTYFTAMVGDDGKLNTFGDVYGHEKRITLALAGKWDQIQKGRDHLAPVELNLADAEHKRAGTEVAADGTGKRGRGKRSPIDSPSLYDSVFRTF